MSGSKTLERLREEVPPVWPPDDDAGGGDGWGGDGDERGGEAEFSSGRLGVLLIMAGVGMIFFSFLTTYLFMRADADVWPPPKSPGLPSGMGLSTLVILASSLSVWLGQRAIPLNARSRFFRWWSLALVFGLAFCLMQIFFWYALLKSGQGLGGNRFTSSFFALTALHAAHVVGGLGYLAYAMWSVVKGESTKERHEVVSNAALFWHFVGAIWLILFGVLTFI